MSKGGARILVVDDEVEIQRALQRSLSAFGYDVSTASSGEQALEKIAQHRPDLLLLDLGLPAGGPDARASAAVRPDAGLEVLRGMRARGDDTACIVLTARDGPGDKVAGLDAGADDYLVKPFDLGHNVVQARKPRLWTALACALARSHASTNLRIQGHRSP